MDAAAGRSKVDDELTFRHRRTSRIVFSLLVLTALLSIIALAVKGFLIQKNDPTVDIAWKIIIVIFGLGSIVLRRTKFSAMRLRDVAGVNGIVGLLKTLEKTTLQVAGIGAFIALVGFSSTVITGNARYTYAAGLIAIVVLLYCFPSRRGWKRTVDQFAPDVEQPPPPPTFQ